MILLFLIFIYGSVTAYIAPIKYPLTQQHVIQYPFVWQPGIRYPTIQHPVAQYPVPQYLGPQYPCLNIQYVGHQCPFYGGYIQPYPIQFNNPTVKQIPAEEPTTITATPPSMSTSRLTSYITMSTNTETPTTSGVSPA